MHDGKDKIKEIVIQATDLNGAAIAIVAFESGGFGITENRQLVTGCRWKEDELKACIDAMVRMTGLDSPAE
jgi:ATP-dependent 26S proteasome regulatory subunit